MITPGFMPKLHAYMAGLLKNMGCRKITIGGVEDHVHILCNMTKLFADKDVLMILKKESSGWVKNHGDQWPALRDFYWQRGYGCFGVSATHRDSVKGYVLNQEEHHRTVTFKEEFIRLLETNQVAYDERYVWD